MKSSGKYIQVLSLFFLPPGEPSIVCRGCLFSGGRCNSCRYRIRIVGRHRERNSWLQEVMCLILNEPIRFEPHTLLRMSTVRKAGQSVQTLPLAPPTGNEEKYGWLAQLAKTLDCQGLQVTTRLKLKSRKFARWRLYCMDVHSI